MFATKIFLAFAAFSSVTGEYLKIVKYYEAELEALTGADRDIYGPQLEAHITMLKRVQINNRVVRQANDASGDKEICGHLASNATKCDKPIAIFLGGGTASGKSSLTSSWQPVMEKAGCGFVHIDPDALMVQLKEWDEEMKTDKSECAAGKLHNPGSRIAKTCFDYVVENKLNFIYDGTMGGYKDTFKRINIAESAGYQVQMYAVTVAAEEAAKRSIGRAKNSKRFVPLCALVDTHKKFASNYRTYMSLIPNNRLFDSTTKEAKVIEENNRVLDKEAFEKFLEKSGISYESVEGKLDSDVKKEYQDFNEKCSECKSEHGGKEEHNNKEVHDKAEDTSAAPGGKNETEIFDSN